MDKLIQPNLVDDSIPNLFGKKVLVIGGTRGIGWHVARKVKDAGASVITIGRTYGEEVSGSMTFLMDVIKYPQLVRPLLSGVDYCLMNIGHYYQGPILTTSTETFREVLERNLVIAYELTRYALEVMSYGGVLVNMASRPTLDCYADWSAYTLAKQGVITLTRSAAEEGGLRCYSVCPSRVDTKFRDDLFPDEDKSTRLPPDWVAEFILKLFNGNNPNGEAYWIKQL